MEKIRLQKYMSDCGIMSRRACEYEIKGGRIKVNGVTAEIGQKIDPASDVIEYKGKVIERSAEKKLYIMLNKPRGYVTTMSDDKGRRCVASLVEDVGTRVYPIGRLDLNSEGLLLFTNDGAVADKLMHPRSEVDKTYHVKLRGSITPEQLNRLRQPFELDGVKTKPAQVDPVLPQPDEENVLLRVTLHEGRNRQIRRMCESLGLEVMRLKRVSVGKISLGPLRTGQWTPLNFDQVKYLKSL